MKKIKVQNWKAKDKDGKEVDENTIELLRILLTYKDPTTLPKGFAQARMFNRFLTSFKEAETSNELILDDEDYNFFKGLVETDTPALWGSNENIMGALNAFIKGE